MDQSRLGDTDVQTPPVLVAADVDNAARWRPGQRLYDLLEARCRAFEAAGSLDHPALIVDGTVLSYGDLQRNVALYAEALRELGFAAGDRVGLLLDRSVASYCVMLAAVRARLVYVPLDPKFPADRIAFIANDAELSGIVAIDGLAGVAHGSGQRVIVLSGLAARADVISDDPAPRTIDALPASAADGPDDTLAYIIYTSGSTGRPKGVAVNHSAICNFVAVAAELYGYTQNDRVYQGLTFAFDFSIEEFWVPLAVGATLVASPSGVQLVGRALETFLTENRITALCCVPTLLATLENDVPSLRFLLVSGEPCPPDIVTRWHRPGRRLLNAYGPTEATVTATWTELAPDRNVTIGVPLATYTIALLDPDEGRLAPPGQTGEIAIAGIGLAAGYVNRPELTSQKFVRDFLSLPNNPSGRLYRTGDLGRIDEHGQIEYLGRIDTQVKLKGYRIELGEIEEALLQVDGIAQAVVTLLEGDASGRRELAGYYSGFDGRALPPRETIAQTLRDALPSFMVPSHLEPLATIPLLPSQKADRNSLPPPAHPRVTVSSSAFVAPATPTEEAVAAALARVLGLDRVSATDHFFEDLGLDSLRAAEFVMALDDALPAGTAAIANVYLAPDVRTLSKVIDTVAQAQSEQRVAEPAYVASNRDHAMCGALQGLTYLVVLAAYVAAAVGSVTWIAAAEGVVAFFGRSALLAGLWFAVPTAVAIAAKWAVIGRWRPQRIKLWSLTYFRFWLVRLLVELTPIAFFRGSPVFNAYLRLLGAEIGENAMINCRNFPLCTDLITVGRDTVLRKDCHLTGYRAEGGYMLIGPISLGDGVTVGESAVVDIDTSIGRDGQLGHASALLSGQSIPDGGRAHGSPARATKVNFANESDHRPSRTRRVIYGVCELLAALALTTLTSVLVVATLSQGFAVNRVSDATYAFAFTFDGLASLAGIYLIGFLAIAAGVLLLNLLIPRLLTLALTPGVSYPNYGVRYYLAGLISTFSNAPFFHVLFGDSSYAVAYVRALGFRQPDPQQTGSNFGTALVQDNPHACEVGSGTMISDDLFIVNFDYAAGSFRLSEARLGKHLFLGNKIVYPANARVGDNCLLASKVMLPVDGEIRRDVGLLGSPSFEIPRSTQVGDRFDPVPKDAEGHARLRAKNRHNLRTMALFLLANWFALFLASALSYLTLAAFGHPSLLASIAAGFAFVFGLGASYIAQERLTLIRGILRPHQCTIHEPYFWWVERHWKFAETPFKYIFLGTPFRPFVYRLLGTRMGRRVFDDGAAIPEKTLTYVGDDACINARAYLQGHSLEDGLYKSDRIIVGAGTTIGPNAHVHYAVAMGANTRLAPDAFLMKGSQTEPNTVWEGNPAARI